MANRQPRRLEAFKRSLTFKFFLNLRGSTKSALLAILESERLPPASATIRNRIRSYCAPKKPEYFNKRLKFIERLPSAARSKFPPRLFTIPSCLCFATRTLRRNPHPEFIYLPSGSGILKTRAPSLGKLWLCTKRLSGSVREGFGQAKEAFPRKRCGLQPRKDSSGPRRMKESLAARCTPTSTARATGRFRTGACSTSRIATRQEASQLISSSATISFLT